MKASAATSTGGLVRALSVVLMAVTLAAHAGQTTIPGTRVSMQMPAGFELADGFAGIAWRDGATSILIAELPTRAIDMRSAMTPSQLATRGMAMIESQVVRSAIGEATLLLASQVVQGAEFMKMILVTGNDSETVLLTATAPAQVWPRVSGLVRDTLLTATWDPRATVDPMASLRFSVAGTADLEPSRALAGAALLVTARDRAFAPDKGGPYAVVGRSAANTEPTELAVVSHARLARTDRFGNARVREEAGTTMGGMPAHELIATGESRGRAMLLYQVMAFDGGNYYLLQGFVDLAQERRFLPQFRQLAASFKVTR